MRNLMLPLLLARAQNYAFCRDHSYKQQIDNVDLRLILVDLCGFCQKIAQELQKTDILLIFRERVSAYVTYYVDMRKGKCT